MAGDADEGTVIELGKILRSLTEGERTILWQALTIDILAGYLTTDTEEIMLLLCKGANRHYFVDVERGEPMSDISTPVMTWHGARVRES